MASAEIMADPPEPLLSDTLVKIEREVKCSGLREEGGTIFQKIW